MPNPNDMIPSATKSHFPDTIVQVSDAAGVARKCDDSSSEAEKSGRSSDKNEIPEAAETSSCATATSAADFATWRDVHQKP